MKTINAFAAHDSEADLEPYNIKRRDVKDDDVEIEITYCGVCHSDIHQVRNDWNTPFFL